MDIVSTANAPRIAYIGKRVFWIRALTFEDFAIILGWLDDVIPGRHQRKMPPALSDDASQKALQSLNGKMLFVWVALRHQGIGFAEAAELASEMSDLEQVRWLDVLYSRRRTMPEAVPDDDARDFAETWCSKGMAELVGKIGMPGILGLSMDQFEWLMKDGGLDDENPAYSPEKLAEAKAAMEEKWGDVLAKLVNNNTATEEAI